jgi:hypothetical protein
MVQAGVVSQFFHALVAPGKNGLAVRVGMLRRNGSRRPTTGASSRSYIGLRRANSVRLWATTSDQM